MARAYSKNSWLNRRVPTPRAMLLLLCLTGCVGHRRQAPSELERIIQPFIDAGYATEINIGLWRDGKRETRHFGQHGRVGDVFEIGSVTKVFTATLLADAVTRGVVKLDDDVARCLPPEVKTPGPITFAQLATHTSGLPRLGEMPMANPRDPYADFDVPRLAAALKTAEVGPQTYAYSNLGVALLGYALGECEKKPYGELVAQVIARPLGLKSTGLDVPLTASGHDYNGAAAPPWQMPLPGAGGLRASVDDLLTLIAAEIDPPPALQPAIALTQVERAKRPGGAVALGWHVGREGLTEMLWHNGESGSFHAFVAFDKQRRLGVVLLADQALSNFDQAGVALMRLLRGEPHAPPLARVVVPAARLAQLAGSYTLGGDQLLVTRREDQLWVQLTGQDTFRIWPVAPDTFELPRVGARLTFAADAAAVTLVENGVARRAVRASLP
jgi:CubicO group peptidase (beta-lactamase class C family)